MFSRGSFLEHSRISHTARRDHGRLLLIAGALVAMVWANTTWADTYETLRDTVVGLADLFGLHLNPIDVRLADTCPASRLVLRVPDQVAVARTLTSAVRDA